MVIEERERKRVEMQKRDEEIVTEKEFIWLILNEERV